MGEAAIIRWLLTILIALLGIMTMLGAAFKHFEGKASLSWPSVEGTVHETRLGAKEQRGDVDYHPRIQYSYEVDGRGYKSDRIDFDYPFFETEQEAQAFLEMYPVGAPLTVYYDPDDPGAALLDPGVPNVIGVIVLGLIFLIGAFVYFRWRTRVMQRGAAQVIPQEKHEAVIEGELRELESVEKNPHLLELVRKLEQASERHPALYRARVAMFGWLGYAYAGAILAVTTSALAGMVFLMITQVKVNYFSIKIVIALSVLLWLVVRGLWVRLEPPTGIELDREQCPELFAMIDDVCRARRAPQPHAVLLDSQFNAAISQVPRLGLLGWQRNYLILGLPLMLAASEVEFRAILAHEFEHLSRAHGRSGGHVYRVRKGWRQLLAKMESTKSWGSFLFRRFFRWYAPTFAAYSFVLARQKEYEADRASAEEVGARVAADSLIRINLASAFLQNVHWDAIRESYGDTPSPEVGPYSSMIGRLGKLEITDSQREGWLKEILSWRTSYDDTHPSPRRRIEALGEEPRIPHEFDTSAAEELLGDALAGLVGQLDDEWREWIEADWREEYEGQEESRARLKELRESLDAEKVLDTADRGQVVRLAETFEGDDSAIELAEQMLAEDPDNLDVKFSLGRMLLRRRDERGVELTRDVMDAEPSAILPGCVNLADYYESQSLHEEKAQIEELRAATEDKHEAARQERSEIDIHAAHVAHGLDDAALERLTRSIGALGSVKSAYLVRRDVEHFPEQPVFALGLVRRWRPGDLLSDRDEIHIELRDAAFEAIDIDFPCHVIVLNGQSSAVKKFFRETPDSRIYG